MRRTHTSAAAAAVVALSALSTPALAEPSPADKALAQQLFRDGRALMTSGKAAEACAKFADSDHLDPQLGTHLNLALCHESTGKTASAWVEFGEVADQAAAAHDTERAQFATKHSKDLEAKLSRVRLHIDQPAKGMSVTIDGAALASSAWGTPMPLDPGQHALRVEAPGKAPWTQTLNVRAGPSSADVAVPALADQAGAGAGSSSVPSAPSTPTSATTAATQPAASDTGAPDATPPSSGSGSPLRTVGLVAAGVGVVGLGVGTYFAIQAKSKQNDANCPNNVCPDPGSASTLRDAGSAGNLATIFVVAGAVLAAGGLTLWLVAPKSTAAALRVTPVVHAGGGAVLVGGAF